MDKKLLLTKKDPNIETIRGMLILLIVAGHVIGSDSDGGMRVDDNSIYRYLYSLTQNVRLPLFTVISGWIYAMHPLKFDSSYLKYLYKKGKRLILPLIFVGGTYFILQHLIPGTNSKSPLSDIWQILVFPYTIYWYLPSLFLIFAIISLIDKKGLISSFRSWSVIFTISILMCYAVLSELIPESVPNYFSFKGMFFLAPFFVLGLGLIRFKESFTGNTKINLFILLTIIGVVLQQIYYFYPEYSEWYKILNLQIPIGIITAIAVMNLKFKNNLLIKVAGYSYTLYLLHGFGTSGGRIIMSWFGATNTELIFLVSFVCAVTLPIAIDNIIRNFPILDMLFLGNKPRNEK